MQMRIWHHEIGVSLHCIVLMWLWCQIPAKQVVGHRVSIVVFIDLHYFISLKLFLIPEQRGNMPFQGKQLGFILWSFAPAPLPLTNGLQSQGIVWFLK